EAQMNKFLVYPNPADKQIDVNYNGLKQIYNMLGERVIHTYDNKIDISNLTTGVYVIKLEDISIRLIKK
ncbi:MAG: T9SS type A sorting domain-containing protein, partial [Candidatus Marinimicrobia bacterium]|nr:T9SS type A sorting domain-containing protein [Candidatus Neomarinimicrobiota bacterium]